MAITIVKDGAGTYRVRLTPPEGASWQADSVMTAKEIFRVLGDRGCHSTDISDALYAANPFWANEESDRR